jgi:Fe-S cluster assembly protein SufB
MSSINNSKINLDRSIFDTKVKHKSRLSLNPGLSEDVVRQISAEKHEPAWMLDKRLKAFEWYQKTPFPTWGPDLSGLELDQIVYYASPDAKESKDWQEVPSEIRETFDKLGIPKAEQMLLGGAGAQFDSDVVYHSLKKNLSKKGVIFENMDVAVQKYPELVKKYFMTQCIPINDHKFIMLHGAVWSGGTFIYVPKGVKVDLPLQAYFRMNMKAGGQFEHTLIVADEGSELEYIEGCSAPRFDVSSMHAGGVEIFVHKRAKVSYISIENWSKNTYNLNTKRALVDEEASMEWLNGNMGSGVTMLYPASILRGRGARSDSVGVAFAGEGQHQDTGSKVIHVAPDTHSTITAKSISQDGGVSNYRGFVRILPKAKGVSTSVVCDALLLDEDSVSETHPVMEIGNNEVEVSHEARVGKIGEEEIFYLMSRGIGEEEARKMIVNGFIEPVVKQLPLEYAVELNRLIEIEMEGSVG